MRWIGLHLPQLSLEAFAATLPEAARAAPAALLEAQRIVDVDAAAVRLGVQPGMKRATALALAPALRLGQADARRDADALAAVAHAALAFTPAVALQPPAQVLLEVQSSLRCFGGFDALLGRLRAALAPLGHRLALASAPTAAGAALLARHAREPRHCADRAALHAALERLPAALLGAQRAAVLQSMGLHTLGELRRLPRAGLARRCGEALLDEIDRAYGERPDPREAVVAPPVFDARLELAMRADRAEQLLHGAAVLLARLVAWSAARQARVRRFTLVMRHEPRRGDEPAASTLEVALAEPSGDAAHLTALLRERLGRLRLAAPTLELQLHCAELVHAAPPNAELFPTSGSEREGLLRLIERLQARLGRERVQRLVLGDDHRPERACAAHAADAPPAPRARAGAAPDAALRPVWLLPEPLPLAERGPLPLLDGAPLALLCGPERIESGWWDGGLAERDYFVAEQADGSLVWVFRGRLPRADAAGWYLHGRFG